MFRKGSPSTLSPWGWMLAQGSAEGPSSMGLKFPTWERREGQLLPGLTQGPKATGLPPGWSGDIRRDLRDTP